LKNKLNKYNLENFGLTIPQFLKIKKKVSIDIHLKYPKYEKFFPYTAAVRKIKINEILQYEFGKLIKLLPNSDFKIIGSKKSPSGIRITGNFSDFTILINKDFIDSIWIRKISGIRKRKPKREKLWFAVKALFNIQFEGFKGGMNKYEERIILVKAYTHDDAKKVAKKEFHEYSYIYLNTDKIMVRWNYERILATYEADIYKDKLDPTGTEVFSEFKYRKLRPEYEWHPIKKYRSVK